MCVVVAPQAISENKRLSSEPLSAEPLSAMVTLVYWTLVQRLAVFHLPAGAVLGRSPRVSLKSVDSPFIFLTVGTPAGY